MGGIPPPKKNIKVCAISTANGKKKTCFNKSMECSTVGTEFCGTIEFLVKRNLIIISDYRLKKKKTLICTL